MKNIVLGRRALLGGAMAATAALPALAAFPERPVRWIVAYPAGGGSDTLARLLGAEMGRRMGQPVVIENRPGAATNIGAEAAAKSPPDGYTLFTADNGTLVFNTALFRNLPYDPARDFRPVGLMARFPLFLVTGQRPVAETVQDFIAKAKANPGGIDYASPGIGSPHHLAMERIAREAGVRFNHVPYRGAAPAVNDLLAGTVPTMVLDYPSAMEHLRSGRIKALAVLSPVPHEELPAVPTVQSALGLGGFEAYAWQGMVVPKATPDVLATQINELLNAALQDEGVRGRMRQIGLEALGGGPREFEALWRRESEVWLPLIRDLKISLD